jgi:hypothetical protein
MRRLLVGCAKGLTPARLPGCINGNTNKDGQFDQIYQEYDKGSP